MTFPIYEKHKSHVPNHPTVYIILITKFQYSAAIFSWACSHFSTKQHRHCSHSAAAIVSPSWFFKELIVLTPALEHMTSSKTCPIVRNCACTQRITQLLPSSSRWNQIKKKEHIQSRANILSHQNNAFHHTYTCICVYMYNCSEIVVTNSKQATRQLTWFVFVDCVKYILWFGELYSHIDC